MRDRIPARPRLGAGGTRDTTGRAPKRPASAGRSATEGVRAGARGSRMSRLEAGCRSTSGSGRILARQAHELVVVPGVDRAGLGLERDDALPVGRLQPGARQRDGGVQLQGPAEAVLSAFGLTAQLANRALLRQEGRVHADALEVVLSHELDDAVRIEAF